MKNNFKSPITESTSTKNYMFFQNLETMKEAIDNMLKMDKELVDKILENGHDWANDHISTSKDDIEEVYNFLKTKINSKDIINLLDEQQFKLTYAEVTEMLNYLNDNGEYKFVKKYKNNIPDNIIKGIIEIWATSPTDSIEKIADKYFTRYQKNIQ
jgi:hypothetical protein